MITSDGILLRSHDYSESSRVLRFLTPHLGIVSLVAKGLRLRSAKGQSAIQLFGEGSITFVHRPDRELHTLREIQAHPNRLGLGRGVGRLAGAALVAELLLVHNMEEGDPELYTWVRRVFLQLASADDSAIPSWILSGAWRTMAQLGFPPQLTSCVQCDGALKGEVADQTESLYGFDVEAGGLVCGRCSANLNLPRVGPRARDDLLDLVRGAPPSGVRGLRAHLSLLEGFATHHLSPRHRLRSFEMLTPILNKQDAFG